MKLNSVLNVENIFGMFIFGIMALFMIGLGVAQLLSKTPVGFYSGEEPPKAEELTDVKAWNKKHGLMWLCYGVIIILSSLIGMWMGDTVWCLIPILGGILLPIVGMIWYHGRLVKKMMK